MAGTWDAGTAETQPYIISGNWDADTNTPDLTSVTDANRAWIITVPGTTDLGGITDWIVNDKAIKTQDGWARERPAATTWGAINGTLNDQTDLKNSLDLKASTTSVALKQDKPATAVEDNIATFNATKSTKDSGKIFTTTISETPVDTKIPTEKAVSDNLSPVKILLDNELSNGLKSGMAISINADPTKINIAAGTGLIVDNSTPASPIVTPITFAGSSAITVTNLATANATYLALNSSGEVVQSTTDFTPAQRRSYILLGAAIHSNRTIVNVVNNLPDVSLGTLSQFNDLLNGLKNFNISGNVISANGANLNINKSMGYIFKKGSNFINDPLNPHTLQLGALTAPTTLRYRLQDGTEYANTAVIDPNFYDNAGVKTAVPSNKYTIQRFTLFSSNLIRIQYGQTLYNSKSEAIQAISTEAFIQEQNIAENGLLRGLLVVKEGTTELNDSTFAEFFEADKFGSTKFSAGGSATTTLQQAYNNSIQPQIVTTAESGAIQFKRGSAADTDSVQEILNGTGQVVQKSYGNGSLLLGDITGGNTYEFENPGTLKFNGTMTTWEDISFPIIIRTTGANIPTIETLKGNLTAPQWPVNSYSVCEGQELCHRWKEASTCYWHIHIYTGSSDVTDRYVNFEVEYNWANANSALLADNIVITSTDVLIPANTPQFTHFLIPISTFTPTGGKIVAHVKPRLKRIASVGAAPSANPFCEMLQLHIEMDTVGSRSITTK